MIKGINETLYYNGDIITMENKDDRPEAVLVRNGVIAEVGVLDEVKALREDRDCKMVDLEGNTLMPSFIDGHGHISMTTAYTVLVDLSRAESNEDIIQMMKEFQEENDLTHGEPIFGYGYDHNFLEGGEHPTRDVLDQVSKDAPVGIFHTSGHMGVANSKILEEQKITADTPNPEGGVIGRYPDSQEPNGYLEETACFPLRMYQAQIRLNYKEKIMEAQMQYVKHGVTTIQDGAADWQCVTLCRSLGEEGRLITDIVSYPCVGLDKQLINTIKNNQDCVGRYVNNFKIGGLKAVLDGSPQGKSAWLTKPYENSGDYCGYPWLKDEDVYKGVKLAIDNNLQMLVHCNGDAAGDQYLNAYEKAFNDSQNSHKGMLRPVMIHCQTARDDQFDRMVKLNMIPSIFVAHVNYWGDVHIKNLGQERGNRVSPVKSALDRNMVYNFHTDTPIVPPDMFHTVWSAANRITRNGIICGPEQRVSVYDALKGVTINAAYEYSEETSKGSIKKGKRADLIIVDKNPLKIDPMAVKDIQVLATIKDGAFIYRK